MQNLSAFSTVTSAGSAHSASATATANASQEDLFKQCKHFLISGDASTNSKPLAECGFVRKIKVIPDDRGLEYMFRKPEKGYIYKDKTGESYLIVLSDAKKIDATNIYFTLDLVEKSAGTTSTSKGYSKPDRTDILNNLSSGRYDDLRSQVFKAIEDRNTADRQSLYDAIEQFEKEHFN